MIRYASPIAIACSLAACETPAPIAQPDAPSQQNIADAGDASVCQPAPLGAPILSGPDVTLDPCLLAIRVQAGNDITTVHLPLAASVAGIRWTVKVWGSDANQLTFLPAVDPETGLMDGMNDIDGDALLDTFGGNPAIILEAFGDTDGPDGPGAAGGPDTPGWMVISR
jgi:hypothetical protein